MPAGDLARRGSLNRLKGSKTVDEFCRHTSVAVARTRELTEKHSLRRVTATYVHSTPKGTGGPA